MKTSGTNMIQSDSDRIEWCQTFVDATFLHTSLDSLRYFVLCFPLLGRPLAWCVALLALRCIVLRCQTLVDATLLHTSLDSLRYFVFCFSLLDIHF